MYYTFKQVLDDPETRGTILIPLGILLLIYPVAIVADFIGLPGSTFGVISALLGLYVLFRGLGLEDAIDDSLERVRAGLFGGRVQLITYVVAAALLAVAVDSGIGTIDRLLVDPSPLDATAAFAYGAVQWVAAAGVVAALGRITDEYLADDFEWRYLNAPFYVLAIAVVLHGLSAFFLSRPEAGLAYLAVTLTAGTLLGLASTLAFAVVEQLSARERDPEVTG
jgi:putative membrane protein